jgi:hypothetical protein
VPSPCLTNLPRLGAPCRCERKTSAHALMSIVRHNAIPVIDHLSGRRTGPGVVPSGRRSRARTTGPSRQRQVLVITRWGRRRLPRDRGVTISNISITSRRRVISGELQRAWAMTGRGEAPGSLFRQSCHVGAVPGGGSEALYWPPMLRRCGQPYPNERCAERRDDRRLTEHRMVIPIAATGPTNGVICGSAWDEGVSRDSELLDL